MYFYIAFVKCPGSRFKIGTQPCGCCDRIRCGILPKAILKNKNPLELLSKGFKKSGAQDWIRTSTTLRMLRPEHSASTNFATWAFLSQKSKFKSKNQ